MRDKEDRRISWTGAPETSTTAGRFVNLCHQALCREVPALVDELFSRLDDVLHELADKSEGNETDAAYLDARRVFSEHRREILSLFLENLLDTRDPDASEQQGHEEPESGTPDSHGIESVGGAELEEMLALTNLISKAESRYRSELGTLRRHIGGLRGQEPIDSRSDPLGPHRLCNAFRLALRPVDHLDLAIKLVVYKLFDKQVVDQLGGVYKRCCEWATGQAATPYAAPKLVETPASAGEDADGKIDTAGGRTVPPTAGDGPTSSGEPGGRAEPTAFRDLQRMLASRGFSDTPDKDGITVDTPELMRALDRLQGSAAPTLALEDLRRRLNEELHLEAQGVSSRTLRHTEQDVVDLVFLLFEHLLQGNEIPEPLEDLFGRMVIPILKAALEDHFFFDDRHHPARRLLNHLAQLAVSWKDDGDRSPASAYGRSRWVVERIGACREWDPAVFAELDAELGRLLNQERKAVSAPDIPAQRNPKSDDGADDAGRLVKAAIDMRLQDRGPVPEAVSSLIYEGWQKVLLAAYRHDGTGGARWQDAMATIDRLVWSVQPKVSDEDRRELLRGIPELLRTLRQSLSEVSLEQQRLALWLKELQALHTMALRGPRRGQADDRPPIGAEVKLPDPSPAHETDRTDPPESNRATTPSPPFGLETGAWVEIRDDDGQLTRAKLAWRSPQSDVWLFVDRQGRKALELSGSDIHDLLLQGVLTVLDDTPIVDRAIREMVRTLRRDRKV